MVLYSPAILKSLRPAPNASKLGLNVKSPKGMRRQHMKEEKGGKDCNIYSSGVYVVILQEFVSLEDTKLDRDREIIWTRIEIIGCKTPFACSYYLPDKSLELLSNPIHKTAIIKRELQPPRMKQEKLYLQSKHQYTAH